MGGCSWQEKSFSVAVSENKLDYTCVDCKKETDGIYKYNGDIFCIDCFGKKSKVKSFGFGFNTDKDLAYNFTTEIFGGRPIIINSKRQFKQLLKQYNLADASIKECSQQAKYKKRVNKEYDSIKRRKTAETIFSKNRERLRFKV